MYRATINSPATVTAVDPVWQEAYDQYRQDLATWQDRYNQWVSYYRNYGAWNRKTVLDQVADQLAETALVAADAFHIADYTETSGQPAVDLSTSRPVARFDSLTFTYLDERQQPTTDPKRVRTVIATARSGPSTASASATIGTGIASASASRSRTVRIPTPCAVDPSKCPPPPQTPADWQWLGAEFAGATQPQNPERPVIFVGERTWSDGTTTHVMVTKTIDQDTGKLVVRTTEITQEQFNAIKGSVQNGNLAGYSLMGYVQGSYNQNTNTISYSGQSIGFGGYSNSVSFSIPVSPSNSNGLDDSDPE